MVTITGSRIAGLTSNPSPASTDLVHVQKTGGGASHKSPMSDYLGIVNAYDLGADYTGTPINDEIVAKWAVTREVSFAADLAGSSGAVTTNPGGSTAFSLKDDGTTIGTVTISTGGVLTFTTVGNTAKTVAAGSVVTLVAPNPADGTLADLVITFKGTYGV